MFHWGKLKSNYWIIYFRTDFVDILSTPKGGLVIIFTSINQAIFSLAPAVSTSLLSLAGFLLGPFLVIEFSFLNETLITNKGTVEQRGSRCSWRHLWRGDDGCACSKLNTHSLAYHRRSLKLCTCRIPIMERNDRSLPASPPYGSQETEPPLSGAGLSCALPYTVTS